MKQRSHISFLCSVFIYLLPVLGTGLFPTVGLGQQFPYFNQKNGNGELLDKIVRIADSTDSSLEVQKNTTDGISSTPTQQNEEQHTTGTGELAEQESEEETTEGEFSVESADSVFVLGKKTEFEGLRLADVGENGVMILIEDNIEPLLYLRFQRLMTEEVQVSVHTRQGETLYNVRKRNLFVGTQVTLNHNEWPMGTHILRVRTSQGDLWKKRIQKNGQFVSN